MNAEESRLRFRNRSTLRSYLELMRLPNVFTAMADVAMGFLFVQAADWHWDPWWDSWTLATLLATSSLLYISGVILNDVFDLETDRRERPERPLPSGRVSLAAARRLGWRLLVLGVLLGGGCRVLRGPHAAGHRCRAAGHLHPALRRLAEADAPGPAGDGRVPNAQRAAGHECLDAPLHAGHWLVAGGIGVYVAGVTWFARRESEESSRLQLAAGNACDDSWHCDAGLVPQLVGPHDSRRGARSETLVPVDRRDGPDHRVAVFLGGDRAGSLRVRMAVTQCILSIVMLDALACYAVRGVFWATMILLLLLPAMFLGRWIEIT